MLSRPFPLLERELEQKAIGEAVSLASRGDGRLVIVEGPGGIGKSRLLEQAAAEARDAGMHVLIAQCRELETSFPYGVALQLLEPVVFGDARAAELLERTAPGARALFYGPEQPEQSLADPGWSLIHGLYRLVTAIAEDSQPRVGMALILDDAQFADRQSLNFVAYLAARLQSLPLAIVLSQTTGLLVSEVSDQLRGSAQHIVRPQPISRTAVSELVRLELGEEAEPSFCATCWELTGGNPFLLGELLSELRLERIEPTAAAADHLRRLAPDSVLRATLVRLTRYPEAAIELARAVAVLGDNARLEDAAALAGLEVQDAEELVEMLADAEILRAGTRLSFVHGLIRSAIYADMSPRRRATAHGLAARLAADGGAPLDTVAAHLLLAPPRPDLWITHTLHQAGRQALRRGDPEAARRYLEHTLATAPPPHDRASALCDLAIAEARSGIKTASARLREALPLLETPEARAAAWGSLGRVLFAEGERVEAANAFRSGRRELPAGHENDDLAQSLDIGFIAAATMTVELRAQGLQMLAPVVERIRAHPAKADYPLIAQIALRLATSGAPGSEVRGLIEASLDLDAPPDISDEGLAVGLLSAALVLADQSELAERHLNVAIAKAQREGSLFAAATASTWRAWPRYHRGAISDAIADVELALSARRDGWNAYPGVAITVLANARLDRDEIEEVRQAVSLRDELSPADPSSLLPDVAAARLALYEGKPELAYDLATSVGDRFAGQWGVASTAICPWHTVAALAAGALGRESEARRLVEKVIASRQGEPSITLGIALRTRALLERNERQASGLHEALSVLERTSARLEYARTLVQLGAALRRGNDSRAAREPLLRGLDLATRFGAKLLAKQAHDELRASGARPRRLVLSGVESLTPTERRVVELAVEGRSNREIAEVLFVTVKNVEQHLSRSYQKLGIKSRQELPRVLAQAQ